MARNQTEIMEEIRLTDKRLRRAKKKGDKENEKYQRTHLAQLQKELEGAEA